MSKLVVIIDDSATVRKIVEVSLRRIGIACLGYTDGVEALRELAKHKEIVPDLVLLDIGLPKMDGYRVAQLLRARPAYQETVIVMLSGRDGMLDRLKGRLSGARTYLAKPFKTQELLEVIISHLGMSVLLPS
jgi:DNA-binding response OmpR family regulator